MNNVRRRVCAAKDKNYDWSQAPALSVVFVNNQDTSIKAWFRLKDWPNSGWTPIGIVVVPGSHNRYGDGTCGVMSLVEMNLTTPETGKAVTSASQIDSNRIAWGWQGYSVGNSIKSTATSLVNEGDNIPVLIAQGSPLCLRGGVDWPYVFSQFYFDSNLSKYVGTPTNSPANGEPYEGGAECYFNGLKDTAAIYVASRTSLQWTASTITNIGDSKTYAPAAMCAGRFKTVGTKSFLDEYGGIFYVDYNCGMYGSSKTNTCVWYLPALGEFSYTACKLYYINDIIVALNQKYGNVASLIDTSVSYWTSCERNRNLSFLMTKGSAGAANRAGGLRVRAFMRL